MRLVCISDTHNLHHKLDMPEGDVLIHAGDATMNGTPYEISNFAEWMDQQDYLIKIYVPGNHDFLFQDRPDEAFGLMGKSCEVLIDSGLKVGGKLFWGSPWTPQFYDWAFMLERGEEILARWKYIPEETDILITHGPPHGLGDKTHRGVDAGCEELLPYSRRAKLHIFGHIHEGYGVSLDGKWANVSSCNLRYKCVNAPVVFDL